MSIHYQNPNPNKRAFSNSVCVDGIIYTHGQLGVSSRESAENFVEQANKAVDLLLAELKEYGAGFNDIFKVNVYLTNKANLLEEYLPWYQERFESNPNPIRTTTIVEAISPNPNACIKIEFVAKKPE